SPHSRFPWSARGALRGLRGTEARRKRRESKSKRSNPCRPGTGPRPASPGLAPGRPERPAAPRPGRPAVAPFSAPPHLTCDFVVGNGFVERAILLTVGESGVQWGIVEEEVAASRPGEVGPMFLGTHSPRLDAKGRLFLPA